MPALPNPRRERFAIEVSKGQTLRDAYRIAGYVGKPKNSSTLRLEPDIDGRINELLNKRQSIEYAATQRAIERLALTKEALAREYVPLVTSNMRNYVTDVGSQVAFDFSTVTPEQWKAVKALQVDEFVEGKGENAREIRRVKLWLHDKVGPGKLVAQLFNWIVPPPRDSGPSEEERLRKLTPEQRAEEMAQLVQQAREVLALARPKGEPREDDERYNRRRRPA
jgi:phage terminase small subunit